MTPKQRVLTALSHHEPDRVPFDLGGTIDTSMHYIAYNNFMRHLGKDELVRDKEQVRFMDVSVMVVQVDTDIVSDLGVDARGFIPGNYRQQWQDVVQSDDRGNYIVDSFGGKWINPVNSHYFDQRPGCFPLAGVDTIQGLHSVRWPVIASPERLEGAREIVKALDDQYAIVIGDPIGGIFAQGFRLRGYENFYLDLAANPLFACALMDKLTEIKLAYWDKVLDAIGDVVDIVLFEDDLGEQDRTMISPRMYRDLIKPRHQELFAFIKGKTAGRVKVLFHSDGSVYDVIPDLIEAGIDILNPIQVSCAKMDSRTLKKDFGKDICFWGGGADSQHVLGCGTVAEVADEVKRRLDDLAPGGGYVFAPIHNIQPEVPPENIEAMWRTLKDYGRY